MRHDNYPSPVSDPEAAGLPDTADDDSTAWDDAESGRIADGPDPGALPLDRDDRPLAVDTYGTTPEEARAGESLDLKLDREVPDPALAGAADPPPDAAEAADAPVEPNLGSPVSMYDTGVGGGTVGRLVAPDEGLGPDVERDAIAYDAGSAGGGASAEEAALHEIPQR